MRRVAQELDTGPASLYERDVGKDHVAEFDRHFAALPADRYPMITSLRGPLLSSGDRDAWALRVLISGILGTPAG